MAIGLVGRKCGMTQIFTENGECIPVTVIEVAPNRITQVKTKLTDGYDAIQITTGSCKVKKLTKPLIGHYKQAGTEPGRGLWEFRLDGANDAFKVGGEIKVDNFQEGQFVDVSSVSKGKGFAGVIKRHNFAAQDATHGNSLSHRAPGSIGQRQSPGRVFKGKKMSGQMGNKNVTVQSQRVVRVDLDKNILLVRGGVPGAPGVDVVIMPAARYKNKQDKSGK